MDGSHFIVGFFADFFTGFFAAGFFAAGFFAAGFAGLSLRGFRGFLSLLPLGRPDPGLRGFVSFDPRGRPLPVAFFAIVGLAAGAVLFFAVIVGDSGFFGGILYVGKAPGAAPGGCTH